MRQMAGLLTLVLATTVLLAGCAGETEEPSVDDLIAQGKACLSRNDHGCAYQAFRKALNRKPSSEQAKYGVILANDQSLSFGLDGILDMLTVDPYAPSQDECFALCTNLDRCGWLNAWGLDMEMCVEKCDPESDVAFGYSEAVFVCTAYAESCSVVKECLSPVIPPDPGECVDMCFGFDECGFTTLDTYGVLDCIDRCPKLYTRSEAVCFLGRDSCSDGLGCFAHYGPFFQKLIDAFYYEMPDDAVAYADDIYGVERFEFDIDYLAFSPFEFAGVPALMTSGVHDEAAVHLYAGFSTLYRALFKIVLAFNIDINTNTIDLMPEPPDDLLDFGADINYLWEVIYMLRDILHDPARPNFGYMTEDGAELLPSASHDIARAMREFRRFLGELKARDDFDASYAFPLDDFNGDGAWSAGELVYLRGWTALDYELADDLDECLEALEATFDDGEPFPLWKLKPILSYYGLDSANTIIDLLGLLGFNEVELSKLLLDPHPNGFRDYIDQFIFILEMLIQLLEGLA